MKFFPHVLRLMRINFILMRYNIGEIFLSQDRFYLLQGFNYFNPYYWRRKNKTLARALRIRLAIEELGPIFVKVGQMLSTRRDIVPEDIAIELAKLQDAVPPFSGKIAKQMIEEELACPLQHVFSAFDPQALASASIAQVHAATLLNGEQVVIKVLRPQIRKKIASDINLLLMLAGMMERYWGRIRNFKPKELVMEVAQTLYDELDLMREAANAAQLRRYFSSSSRLYIPKIYWSYSRTSMLVMERIHGIPIHDIKSLEAAGVNKQKLAECVMEVFLTQVFRDSFFHADVHPGNIFVCAKEPQSPSLIAVDFGIVGSLSQDDRRYIAENMVAFFKRDYQRVAELHIACGWLPPSTRIDQFEGAIRAVSEPILEQALRDISFGKLLFRLFQVARRFDVNIQPQLILLQKTLLNVEGLCQQLVPQFDLWNTAAPQIELWLKKQIGFPAFIKRLRENLPLWSEQIPQLPALFYEVLKEKKHAQERTRFKQEHKNVLHSGKNNAQYSLRFKINYFFRGMLFAACVAAVMIYFNYR
jgi:ubiquinone biosynthesis protein